MVARLAIELGCTSVFTLRYKFEAGMESVLPMRLKYISMLSLKLDELNDFIRYSTPLACVSSVLASSVVPVSSCCISSAEDASSVVVFSIFTVPMDLKFS